jgi:hypothetical protein
MRLAWCDKIGLAWGLFLAFVLAAAWKGTWLWWGDGLPPYWYGLWEFGWRFVGVPWLALRLLDMVTGGPSRRAGQFIVRPLRDRN